MQALCEFVEFNHRGDDGQGQMERSKVWLSRVYAWMATVLRGLTEWNMCRGQHRKLYIDTQRKEVDLGMEQLTGNLQVFVHNGVEGGAAMGTGTDVSHVVEIPPKMERYLRLQCQWFWQFVASELGAACDGQIIGFEIGNESKWH